MRRIAVFAIALLGCFGWATPTVRSTFASDASGNAVTPRLGDEFYVAVDLVSARPGGEWTRLGFDALSGARQTPRFLLVGSGRVIWGPFQALAHGPTSIAVRVEGSSRPTNLTISAAEPDEPVEYYAARPLELALSAQYVGRPQSSIVWWIPAPVDGPSQTIELADQQPTSLLVPGLDFAAATGGTSVSVSARITARSQRTNLELLRRVSWSEQLAAAGLMSRWTQSETFVESDAAEIARWRTLILGSTVRAPIEQARLLYLAVIQRLQYQPGLSADALAAFRSRKADCGGFSTLFVALCRGAGIPARSVAGALEGTDRWHVWAELWIAGAGWIAVDPSAADALRPQGDQALYFGIMPGLNGRVATEYGADRRFQARSVPWLQSPAAFLGDPRAGIVQPHVSVQPGAS